MCPKKGISIEKGPWEGGAGWGQDASFIAMFGPTCGVMVLWRFPLFYRHFRWFWGLGAPIKSTICPKSRFEAKTTTKLGKNAKRTNGSIFTHVWGGGFRFLLKIPRKGAFQERGGWRGVSTENLGGWGHFFSGVKPLYCEEKRPFADENGLKPAFFLLVVFFVGSARVGAFPTRKNCHFRPPPPPWKTNIPSPKTRNSWAWRSASRKNPKFPRSH